MEETVTLYELNRMVAQVVNQTFDAPIWITAEIAQAGTAGNGHCYLELIEKNAKTGIVTARARAIIWANRWWLLNESFELETGQRLQAGIKVMVEVQVQMHEQYGYSLVVQNIDPSYTMGEMQRRRQEILLRLKNEGMIEANKSLQLPTLTQRIAVISTSNAAGYGDFCHQLENNEYGLKFYVKLFSALLQGDQTEGSVIAALDRIYAHIDLFDVVVIIRGGGSTVDLSSFDSYELALNVANFPIPVFVGIGHERDTTVLDAVAHTSVKTPTAAAVKIIDHQLNELNRVEGISQTVMHDVRERMEREKLRIARLSSAVCDTHLHLGQQINQLTLFYERVRMMAVQRLQNERQRLAFAERSIAMAQPDNILRRGFSIVRIDGKAVKDASKLTPGTVVETQTANGTFSAEVIKTGIE